MILPVIAYGDPVLRKEAEEINADYPNLKELIANMYETMYASSGVGLAAPQVGVPIRLFVIDAAPMFDDGDEEETNAPKQEFKRTFINAYIIQEEGKKWEFEEGCLSIPTIREKVSRHSKIKIEYQDEDFKWHEEEFDGIVARIIQHEHDHTDGILFIDHIAPLRRRLLKGKLSDISAGRVNTDYRMKYPK
jgi:peptide deformylase